MIRQPIVLSKRERKIVLEAISDYCWKHKYPLGALNVRSNHVHLLVRLQNIQADVFCRSIKAFATTRLQKNSLRFQEIDRIWGKGTNTTRIAGKREWGAYARYTLERQGANDYLTEEEWLYRSRVWIPNAFEIGCPWRVVFDGKKLRWRPKE